MATNVIHTAFVSFAKTLAIIPPVGVVAGAALYFWVKSHASVLNSGSLNSDPAELDLTLSQVAGGVMLWMLESAAVAWITAAVFVVIAALRRAPTARAESGMRWAWLLFLILTVVVLATMAVFSFGPNLLGFDLRSGFFLPVAPVAVLALSLLYWLTTLFATPEQMGPSVPGYEMMPRFRGRRES